MYVGKGNWIRLSESDASSYVQSFEFQAMLRQTMMAPLLDSEWTGEGRGLGLADACLGDMSDFS